MRVYLSGSYDARDRIRRTEIALRPYADVSSTWLREPAWMKEPPEFDTVFERRLRANQDIFDIERSDVMVVFTDVPSTTGALYAELGIALALHIPVYTVGNLPLPDCQFFYTTAVQPILLAPPWLRDACLRP